MPTKNLKTFGGGLLGGELLGIIAQKSTFIAVIGTLCSGAL
jgi:hypothetical protein